MKRSMLFSMCLAIAFGIQAQYTIINIDGYTPQIGALISMLDDLKGRVTRQVKELDLEETDFLLDDQANRFGALILHLAATERYFQLETFYDTSLDEEQDKEWLIALHLGEEARNKLTGKPISYYLAKWDEVRTETKEVLKTKDEKGS